MVSISVFGDCRRGGQHAGRHRLLGNSRVFSGDRFRRVDRVQGEGAALGELLVALVLDDPRGVRDRDHGAEARGKQFVEGRTRRRHLHPRGRVGVFGEFENIADQRDAVLVVGDDRDLLFLQVGDRLDLLAAGTEQQHQIMIEDRDRAGAGRDLGVGAQYRKIGVLAVELRQRLCIVAAGHDLELQPRGIVLQQRRQAWWRSAPRGRWPRRRQRSAFRNYAARPGHPTPLRRSGPRSGLKTARSGCGCSFSPANGEAAFPEAALRLQRSWLLPGRGRFAVKLAPQAVQMNS